MSTHIPQMIVNVITYLCPNLSSNGSKRDSWFHDGKMQTKANKMRALMVITANTSLPEKDAYDISECIFYNDFALITRWFVLNSPIAKLSLVQIMSWSRYSQRCLSSLISIRDHASMSAMPATTAQAASWSLLIILDKSFISDRSSDGLNLVSVWRLM